MYVNCLKLDKFIGGEIGESHGARPEPSNNAGEADSEPTAEKTVEKNEAEESGPEAESSMQILLKLSFFL